MPRPRPTQRWRDIKPNDPLAWQEFCGFLGLTIDEYTFIQERLLQEQLSMWCASGIGRRILAGALPENTEQFRAMVPLTTYDDYADVLLQRRNDMLPQPAVTWVETTWEGGKRPVKVAPYTQGIVDTFRRNSKSVLMLASASGWCKYTLGDKALQGLAPLPYLTGLMGLFLEQEFQFKTMPPCETAKTMRFSERTKLGFKTALAHGTDYFFGLGSISYFMSKQLTKGRSSSSSSKLPLPAVMRYLKGKRAAKAAGRELLPSDLFQLTGFICAGTDNACYKDDLEKLWGVRPMELFAGTESSLVGTETFNRKDLYFFPDCCFYEFLPSQFIRKNERFMPTVTIDQVQADEEYELIITNFKGGAFARYRTGDVYRCTGIGEAADHSTLPRFRYIDRVPTIIDIAGFTRITESSIAEVIDISHLPIKHWCAAKEFHRDNGHPYLHMYLEMDPSALGTQVVSEELLRRHLEIYFNYLDNDYDSLKRILEMEPLQLTFVQTGTFQAFEDQEGSAIDRVNPSQHDLRRLRQLQGFREEVDPWGVTLQFRS